METFGENGSVVCFLNGFLSNFLADLAAGALLLSVGYVVFDRTLHLRERAERREEAAEQRQRTREAILGAVHAELESNAAQLQTALTELPRGNLLYPGFEVTGWPLISQLAAFTTLKRETIERLAAAYNRMSTANEQRLAYKDLYHGPTSILATAAAAPALDNPKVKDAYEMFQNRVTQERDALIDRLTEFKDRLDEAIDAVENELNITGQVSAAKRQYVPDLPAAFVAPPSKEETLDR